MNKNSKCPNSVRRGNRIRFARLVKRLLAERDGAVGVEYAFLITFIAIVGAVGFVSLGTGINAYFDGVSRPVAAATAEMSNPFGGGGDGTSTGSDGGSGPGSDGGPGGGGPGGPSGPGSNGNGGNNGNGGGNGKNK